MPYVNTPAFFRPTESLAGVIEKASESERALIQQMLTHYLQEVQALAHKDPASVARAMHRATDTAVTEHNRRDRKARDVKCKGGCDHCCHIPAYVTEGEAALLVGLHRERIDGRRLEAQARLTDDEFMALPKADRACVFLKDQRCTVYRDRPIACRKHQVISEPKHCDTVRFPGAQVIRLVAIEAEVVASAVGTLFPLRRMSDALKGAMQ